jgi:hypothetical protein
MTSNTALPPAQGDDLFELRAVRRVAGPDRSRDGARACVPDARGAAREERLGTRLFLRSTHGPRD